MGTYGDLKVGERIVTPGKTITHAATTIMTGLGGYTHPMFNDEEYCKANTPFGGMVAPGEMTLFFMGGLAEASGIFDETVIALVGLDNIRFRYPTSPGGYSAPGDASQSQERDVSRRQRTGDF